MTWRIPYTLPSITYLEVEYATDAHELDGETPAKPISIDLSLNFGNI